jgi:hypothetical protein
MPETGWLALAVGGVLGRGVGLGVVLGAVVARMVRRYVYDDRRPDDRR